MNDFAIKLGWAAAQSCLTSLNATNHVKIALDENSINQILRVAKSKQLKVLNQPSHHHVTILDPKRAIADAAHVERVIPELKGIADNTRRDLNATQSYTRGKTTIFVPKQSDAKTIMRTIPNARVQSDLNKIRTPQHRKLLETIMKGHELAETQVKSVPYMRGFMHRSPDVILREHNMLTTLPHGGAPVRNLFRNMRKPFEARAFKEAIPQFTYGKGQRLSRHARRRMTDLYAAHAEKELAKLRAAK